jgi:hypothetical protein
MSKSGNAPLRLIFTSMFGIAAAVVALTGTKTMSQPKCNILKIAHAYILQNYPTFDSAGLKPVISQTGKSWQVTYDLPTGMLGGAPIITIDKGSCKVVRAAHSQ